MVARCSSFVVAPETSADTCDLEMASTSSESVAKRAKIDILSFAELNLQELLLKQTGTAPNGQMRLTPMINNAAVIFNLTPKEWAKTEWGFDYSGRFENPSFLGGPEPAKPGIPEGLKLSITLSEQQIDFINKLDTAAKLCYLKTQPKAKWLEAVKGIDAVRV